MLNADSPVSGIFFLFQNWQGIETGKNIHTCLFVCLPETFCWIMVFLIFGSDCKTWARQARMNDYMVRYRKQEHLLQFFFFFSLPFANRICTGFFYQHLWIKIRAFGLDTLILDLKVAGWTLYRSRKRRILNYFSASWSWECRAKYHQIWTSNKDYLLPANISILL